MNVDTFGPVGFPKSTRNEFKDAVGMVVGRRARWNDGGEGGEGGDEGTPLPESLAGNESYASFGTVEKLAEAYDGVSKKTYLDFLGEDAKNDPDITRYKTGEDLYKGFKNNSKLVGKKGIIKPTEGASESEWNEYYKSLGVPASASEYSFNAEVDPNIATPEAIEGFKAFVHKHKLTSSQAEGVFQEYFGMLSQAQQNQMAKQEEDKKNTEAQLRSEWGADFAENSTIARRLVEKFGGQEVIEAFGDLGNNPKVLKFLGNLGRKISEDSFTGLGAMALSTDEAGAKRRIAEIESDPALMNESDPRHYKLVEERDDLYKVAYPNE